MSTAATRSSLVYFANPNSRPARDAMARGLLGQMVTPDQGNRIVAGARWVLDNGCFSSRWTPERWSAALDRYADRADECLWAVVPDVVADAEATNRMWARWWSAPMRRGYRLAYVAQDGCWYIPAGAKAVFLGGSTEWKLGPQARAVAALTKRMGLWLHCGRVNSLKRLQYAAAIGCDSVDGTYLAFGPDANLPRLLEWLREVEQQPSLLPAGVV